MGGERLKDENGLYLIKQKERRRKKRSGFEAGQVQELKGPALSFGEKL